mmetsp:Transcript_16819/g.26979  ORF Transcript_16819/g.26979 Transcript_16819/m.26979 type:complete len:95 (+) Transcript_16819:92-376(+)
MNYLDHIFCSCSKASSRIKETDDPDPALKFDSWLRPGDGASKGAKNQPPAKKSFNGGSSFASQQGSFLYTRVRVCCVHAPFGRAASGAAARHSH